MPPNEACINRNVRQGSNGNVAFEKTIHVHFSWYKHLQYLNCGKTSIQARKEEIENKG